MYCEKHIIYKITNFQLLQAFIWYKTTENKLKKKKV